jgi:hypothetical protein
MRTLSWVVCGLVCLGSVPGCSSGLAEVSGTVSLNGEPVKEGAINFIPIDGTRGAGAGAAIEDGRYHIPGSRGVTPGKNRVELRAFRTTGRKVPDPTGRPGTLADERVPAFPPEFNDQSTLTREVRPGSNTFNFDVTTPEPGKPPSQHGQ